MITLGERSQPGAVAEAVTALAAYLPALETLISREPEPSTVAVTMTGATTSSPPWYAPAANVVMGAHAGVRRLEQQIREDITGRPHTARGGSGANTAGALKAIGDLAPAASGPVLDGAVAELAGWVHAAAQLPDIDDEPRWVPLARGGGLRARERGEQPALCPYCGTPSLRYAKLSAMVRCFRVGCRDAAGDPPQGQPGWSHGSLAILWDDGLVT